MSNGLQATAIFKAGSSPDEPVAVVDLMPPSDGGLWRVAGMSYGDGTLIPTLDLIWGTSGSQRLEGINPPMTAYLSGNVQVYARAPAGLVEPQTVRLTVAEVCAPGKQVIRRVIEGISGAIELPRGYSRLTPLAIVTITYPGGTVAGPVPNECVPIVDGCTVSGFGAAVILEV